MLNIILYRPEMPANVGNIIRTAAAINARLHIIGPIVFSLDEKSLKRAGLDYIIEDEVFLYANLEAFNEKFPQQKIYYVTRYSHNVYTQFAYGRYDEQIFCMFGSESYGIPRDILKANEATCMRIPMVANIRSLNLSNAVAIVSYEILRQQNFYNLATSEMIKGDDFL